MKRQQQVIALASAAGLLLFLGARFLKRRKQSPVVITQETPTTENTTPTGLDLDKRLEKGVRGPEVRYLQQLLIRENLLSIGQDDGIFGPITEQALVAGRDVIATTLRAFIAGIR